MILFFNVHIYTKRKQVFKVVQIDSSSLGIPLDGDESSLRSVLDIHDSSE